MSYLRVSLSLYFLFLVLLSAEAWSAVDDSVASETCIKYVNDPTMPVEDISGFVDAERIITDIKSLSDKIGITTSGIKIIPCKGISKAYALRDYILYNPDWLRNVTADNRWEVLTIMAHELGHHVNRHLTTRTGEARYVRESEADKFAGCAIARLGGNWASAENVFRSIRLDHITGAYPTAEKAVEIGRDGYERCGGSDLDTIRFDPKTAVFRLQKLLENENCRPGISDGLAGYDTNRAIRLFNLVAPERCTRLDPVELVSEPPATISWAKNVNHNIGAITTCGASTIPICGADYGTGFLRDMRQGCYYYAGDDLSRGESAIWTGGCNNAGYADGPGTLRFIYQEKVASSFFDNFDGQMRNGYPARGVLRRRSGDAKIGEFRPNTLKIENGVLASTWKSVPAYYRYQFGNRIGSVVLFLKSGRFYVGDLPKVGGSATGAFFYEDGIVGVGKFNQNLVPNGLIMYLDADGKPYVFRYESDCFNIPGQDPCSPPPPAPGLSSPEAETLKSRAKRYKQQLADVKNILRQYAAAVADLDSKTTQQDNSDITLEEPTIHISEQNIPDGEEPEFTIIDAGTRGN